MKHKFTLFTLMLVFCFSASLTAQKNPTLQQANKEFDLHAYNLAIKSYRKVLEKDPDNAIAYAGVADCYRLLNRMTEAADWYKKALQLPDVDPTTLYHYGITLMALGEYERASEWLLVYAEGQPAYGNHFAESCDFAISLRGMPALYRVKKEFVNTEASDFGPAFFKGNVVYSSARTDMVRKMEKDHNNWNGAAKNQLFISGLDANGFLTKPDFLQSDLQNAYNEGLISYSKDGNWVAFTKNNFINGTRQIPAAGLGGSLFIATAKADGSWNEAKPFPHNGSGYSSVFPYLSEDGQKLYFSSNRPDGYGGFDLYVSYRIGATWTSPENLGPVVNSEGNEISPYMDNGLLYFASDWHHGVGGMDIFKAVREEGLWSKVFHLGNGVNSPADDYGLIYNAKANKGYFVSNRKDGAGNEDIYSLSKISDDATIVVSDSKTGQIIGGVALDFTACGSETFYTDEKGEYRFQVFDGLQCDVVVSKQGYKSAIIKLDAANASNSAFTVVLEAAPNAANLYSGLLFNSRDNNPVSGVVVSAQAKGSEDVLKATSASNGSYSLALKPNSSYIVRYSKMGYLDTHQKIETGTTVQKDILGVLMLNASTISLNEKPEIVTSGPVNNNTSTNTSTTPSTIDNSTSTTTTDVVEEEDPADKIVVDIINNQTKVNNTDTPKAEDSTTTETVKTTEPQEGYAVQVAALGVKENLVKKSYMPLSGIGNLYHRPEGGMKKVRVGIYRSKEAAAQARKSIVAKGFSSAFVVKESVSNENEISVFDSAPSLETAPVPEEEVATTKGNDGPETNDIPADLPVDPAATVESLNSAFMVRLATYSKPEFFDGDKVRGIGKVEQRLKGNMTIMLLSGFPDLQTARDASRRAIDRGFSGAHVVMEENGKLIKI